MGNDIQRNIQRRHKATTVALAIALPSLSFAAEETALPTIQVQATSETGYMAPKVQSSKYTEKLVDTPKTITVLTKETLKDQGILSLREALSTTPGITFQAGEGGGGYGDKINIRGFDSTYDMTVDGLRDSALTNRSDMFNIEGIEVAKGSGSSINGMGAVGGTVNMKSKMPKGRDSNEVSVGLGTDNYYRVTGDFNRRLSETIAARVNVMGHRNDIAGREVENNKRWGIAPSITFGLGTDTRTTLSYLHQEDNNTPQYGVPYYNGKPIPGINSEKYYGYSNLDDQDIQTDYLTLNIESELSPTVKLNSISRIGRVAQDTTVSAPQANAYSYDAVTGKRTDANPAGELCLANGTRPVLISDFVPNGFEPCSIGQPGVYTPNGPRGYRRDTVNRIATNDTNITWRFNTGSIEHAVVTGFNLTREEYDLTTAGYLYNADGSVAIRTPMDTYNPGHVYTGPINYFETGWTTGKQQTGAVYLLDTIKLNPMFEINVGARYDHVEGSTQTTTYDPSKKVTTVGAQFESKDDLLSYNGALVFKPTINSSLYAAYANSHTPSKASVNGGCTALINCNVEPEKARTYEIGGKWQVNPNLLLNASVFRTDRTNYRVTDTSNPTNPAGYQTLDGSSRVEGIEVGASGKILPEWNVYAAFAYLDSEVLQGTSDYYKSQGKDYTKGDKLLFVPEFSGSFWTTYDINPQWQVGYGFTYTGEQYVTQHSATATKVAQQKANDYWVHNLAVTYNYSKDLSLQLNVKNIFNEEYYTAIRSGWAMPGEGVNGVLSLNYKF